MLAIALLLVLQTSAQKLKGSKNVTVVPKDVTGFDAIEVTDNIDLFVTFSDRLEVETEADDNLQESIRVEVNAGTLYVSAINPVANFRMFSVKVSMNSLKKLVAKSDAKVTFLNTFEGQDMTIQMLDQTKLWATIKSDRIKLLTDGKSKSELNLNSPQTALELSGNSVVKALISADALTIDQYQKSDATIEGDCNNLKLNLDNNARLTGKNLTAKQATVSNEGYAKGSVEVLENILITNAGGHSELELFGEQKIVIDSFKENAVISKKNNKVR